MDTTIIMKIRELVRLCEGLPSQELAAVIAKTTEMLCDKKSPVINIPYEEIKFTLSTIQEAKHIGKGVHVLLTCGWDFTDPGEIKDGILIQLHMPPEKVKRFLESYDNKMIQPAWSNLTKEQQNSLIMFSDAFERWYKAQQ